LSAPGNQRCAFSNVTVAMLFSFTGRYVPDDP
jgi:hypothetical protein